MIKVVYDPPPIPSRTCDYQAYLEGHEELGTGYGPTREDALKSLFEVFEMKDLDLTF